MRRIIVIAAGMAGITCATKIKRRLSEDEINLVLPATLKDQQESSGPIGKRIAAGLPNLELLSTRDIGILETTGVMPDLEKKALTVHSARGRLPVRFDQLIIEVEALPRIPRSLQGVKKVIPWPLPSFSSQAALYDGILAEAASGGLPALVIGSGIEAFEACLIAHEAGLSCIWLYLDKEASPWVEPQIRQNIAAARPGLEWRSVPATHKELQYAEDDQGNITVTLPDGQSVQGACVLWSSTLMAAHPILREDGFLLDADGRITAADGRDDIILIGNGTAAPSAVVADGVTLPPYVGGQSASVCIAGAVTQELTTGSSAFSGLYGLRKAADKELGLYRAGLTMREAAAQGIEAEHTLLGMPAGVFLDASATPAPQGKLMLALVCQKSSGQLLGVQVGSIGVPAPIADGLFGMAFAALAEKTPLQALAVREHAGSTGFMLARAASMLQNKLKNAFYGITPDELLASAEAGAEFFILDLRSPQEWEERKLADAYNIPMPQLKKRLQDEVPRFTPLVLVCNNGNNAYVVGCKLAGLGASELYVLEGGMRLWPYPL